MHHHSHTEQASRCHGHRKVFENLNRDRHPKFGVTFFCFPHRKIPAPIPARPLTDRTFVERSIMERMCFKSSRFLFVTLYFENKVGDKISISI